MKTAQRIEALNDACGIVNKARTKLSSGSTALWAKDDRVFRYLNGQVEAELDNLRLLMEAEADAMEAERHPGGLSAYEETLLAELGNRGEPMPIEVSEVCSECKGQWFHEEACSRRIA